jgi:hypothetical protein
VLAGELKKGAFDLIIAGHRAVDDDNFQVGPAVAEFMGIPHISMVIRQEMTEGKIRCTRTIDGGTLVLETALPALITTQRGLNEPRYTSLPGIMKAKKKPIDTRPLSETGIDPGEAHGQDHCHAAASPAKGWPDYRGRQCGRQGRGTGQGPAGRGQGDLIGTLHRPLRFNPETARCRCQRIIGRHHTGRTIMSKGILAITEQVDGAFKNISFEVISAGKKIAEKSGGPLIAAVMGAGVDAIAGKTLPNMGRTGYCGRP